MTTTKISTIYDALDTLISSALTGYVRFPNPYSMSENPETFLRKGYGIGVDSGENTHRFVSGKRSFLRNFSVIITNQVVTTDSNVTARKTIEKSFLEDFNNVFIAIEANPTLSDNCISLAQVSDSGIEFVETDRGKYIAILITIQCEYLE